jgi:hypothetical protein
MGLLFSGRDRNLYFMAFGHIFKKIAVPASHLPTVFFIIGYPFFWLELYSHSALHGVTSPLAWVLWSAAALISVGAGAGNYSNGLISLWQSWDRLEKWLWSAGLCLAFIILGIVLVAALKPIHLLQEADCMQYHYTLPRQHLILGSFSHIPWAADDLFLLPVEFALAPFWFAAFLPNKIPQFILLLGLIGVAARLTSSLAAGKRPWAGFLMVLFILGTHGFGIQMGTGMLDLAIAYLLLASLDSLLLGNWFLAGVEFTFFFWSKPLMPAALLVTAGIWAVLFVLARQTRWQMTEIFNFKNWRMALGSFFIMSLAVAGPFIAKSVDYAGTPFFPLAPGIMETDARIKAHPQAWQSLRKASIWIQATKNGYGHGRDIWSFIKHLWLVAVPEKGVNNSFDYPLGLTYLLLMGPFLFYLIKDISGRKFPSLSVLAAVIWMLWWFGPQQTRFLYVPLFIIFMVTISRLENIPKPLILCLLISLFIESVSVWGAHKADIGRWGIEVLRSQDRQLVDKSKAYIQQKAAGYVDWPVHDVAYAQFPVRVTKEALPRTNAFDILVL